MAIKFLEARNTLVRDLELRGFEVEFVRRYSNGPGRTVDVCLANGVVVNLDRHSSLLWAEGPCAPAMKVEAFLRRRYESGSFIRAVYILLTTVFLGFPLRILRFFVGKIPAKVAAKPLDRPVERIATTERLTFPENLLLQVGSTSGR